MPLKYCITNQENDANVLDHPTRGPERIEKMLGIHWDIIEDTITAIPKYNLHGTSRGKELGPLLKDMSDNEIMELPITRMVFLRLSAQTYSKLANLLGPLIMSTKALSSRSCELAGLDELEEDLEDRDPEFVRYARKYIINLKKTDTIVLFPRC